MVYATLVQVPEKARRGYQTPWSWSCKVVWAVLERGLSPGDFFLAFTPSFTLTLAPDCSRCKNPFLL